MKKIITSTAMSMALLSSSLYAANNCPDFTGTYAGSCANFPIEFVQVRSVISQQGCENVQLLLDVMVTQDNIPNLPPVAGTKFLLRTMDMHPGNNKETFVREEPDTNTITTYIRYSNWNNNKTALQVDETTEVTINGQPVGFSHLVGEFFINDDKKTINLDITKGENEPGSSGDCQLFKLP